MNETAFGYDASDNITAYNGSAFKAGDEFPQSATDAIGYVTATSANIDSTIDNVSANSGAWGGSALPISAGPGIKVNLVDNTLVFSNDETVLFETTADVSTATLSENTSAFDRVNFYIVDDNYGYAMCTLPSCIPGAWKCGNYLPFGDNPADFGDYSRLVYVYTDKNNGGMNWSANGIQKINGTAYNNIGNGYVFIKKVVGINRIAGGN